MRATVRSFAQTNNTFGRTFDCCALQVLAIRRSLRDSWAKVDVKLFCPVRHLDGSSPVKRESVARVDDFPDGHVHRSDDHQQKHVNSSHRRHLQQSVTSTPQSVAFRSVKSINEVVRRESALNHDKKPRPTGGESIATSSKASSSNNYFYSPGFFASEG